MSRYVVDANVPVKWFVPEVLTSQALRLLEGDHELVAPDLLYAEVGNALWQKVRRKYLAEREARGVMDDVLRAPLTIHPTRQVTTLALELALRAGCTVYDGCYLGLAMLHDCPLVTADQRLQGFVPARYRRHVLPLSSLPA